MKVANTSSLIRNSKSEIPNITGTLNRTWVETGGTGALYRYGQFGVNWLGSNLFGSACSIGIDASLSSNRYGSYTEVNPLYNSCKYLISY